MDKNQERLQGIWTNEVKQGEEPAVIATVRVKATVAAIKDKAGVEVAPAVVIDEDMNLAPLYSAMESVLRSYAYAGAKLAAVARVAKVRGVGGEISLQQALEQVCAEHATAMGVTNLPEPAKKPRVDQKQALMAELAAAIEGMTDKQKLAYMRENGYLPA